MKELIQKTIKAGGKCSEAEYAAICKKLSDRKNETNFLVFGTGHDTPMWRELNKGTTMFVENSPRWIDGQNDIIQVVYASQHLPKDKILPNEKLHMDLGAAEDIDWGVIFVDGPVGRTQGRMKSIYNAYRLATKEGKKKKCVVLVHDYNRRVEKLHTDHYFKNVEVVHRLAICSM